ncbi:MAG: hypothetical protein PHE06_11460 [Lachnospiraceae bacterium]|nr:hypothetical protein [Lachnospiraceae bacterium]
MWKNKFLQCFFGVGCLGLAAATVSGIWLASFSLVLNASFWAGILLSVLFFALLIDTLFFALPMKATYGDHVGGEKRTVCSSGMYALCRHPGVLWLAGMYAGIWLALPGSEAGTLFLTTTVCNVFYVWFQDSWTFPNIFDQYEKYRHSTPFLIPTMKSIRACISDLKERKCGL